MQKNRLLKPRFGRRFKQRQEQAQDLSGQAERSFERYFFKRLERLKPVRRFVIGWTALTLLSVIGVLFQTYYLSNYYQTLRAVPGGIYREGVLGTFNTANPLYAAGDVDSTVSHLLFSGLFKHDQRNALVGDLASSYQINPSGTVYTVRLKPNLRWHDNQPLTSADVQFTYQAIQNPDARSTMRSSWQGVVVTAPNPNTVVFTLPGPLASFPNNMINGIIPKHLLSRLSATEFRTADFNTINPVGSGPFKWQGIQVSGSDPSNAQEQLAFLPFAGYVAGKPKLDRLVVHAYADQRRLKKDFQSGALTGASGLSAVPENLIRRGSTVQVHNFLLTAGTYAFFKTSQPILASQKVRQALVQAADPAAIIKELPYATRPVRGPLLIRQFANDASLEQPKHDLSAAQAALDADGWLVGPDGLRSKGKQKLSFNLVASDTPEYRQVSQDLQRQWRNIGVDLKVRLQTQQNFQNTLAYHDYDVILYNISIGTDPDVFVYWDSSQADIRSSNRLNLAEYKSPVADAALESGRTRLDPALRTVKYRPFLQAWQQDSPALGLYQPRVLYLTNGAVDGLTAQTVNGATDRFNNVQNWMIRQAKVTNN